MEIEEAVRGGSSSRGSGSRRQRRGGRGGSRGGVPDNDWDETSERLILDENGYQTLRSRRRVSFLSKCKSILTSKSCLPPGEERKEFTTEKLE